ncbi:MAG TPA: MarR family transcriptional regulator [Solirubrobacterales bacterium]|nr:MarR family transcriptional regulator [Solirubrobacterales bacterium]
MEGEKVGSFGVLHLADLTVAVARELRQLEDGSLLVRYERSSPEARTLLRKAAIPFVGGDGEVYLHLPPLHVELPGRGSGRGSPPSQRPAPFALRSSRVSRWLLLNGIAEPTIRELSEAVELSESVTSRTVAALAEERLVEVEVDRADARARRVRVRDTGALLDAFDRGTGRRVRSSTWDVGGRDVEKTIDRLQSAATRGRLDYALGGLSGASFLRRAVEPMEVEAWIVRGDYDRWLDKLTPIAARRGPGRLTVNLLPDPYLLTLAWSKEGVSIADPLQLYLDCRRTGERALEAADAIRKEMNW